MSWNRNELCVDVGTGEPQRHVQIVLPIVPIDHQPHVCPHRDDLLAGLRAGEQAKWARVSDWLAVAKARGAHRLAHVGED